MLSVQINGSTRDIALAVQCRHATNVTAAGTTCFPTAKPALSMGLNVVLLIQHLTAHQIQRPTACIQIFCPKAAPSPASGEEQAEDRSIGCSAHLPLMHDSPQETWKSSGVPEMIYPVPADIHVSGGDVPHRRRSRKVFQIAPLSGISLQPRLGQLRALSAMHCNRGHCFFTRYARC